MMFYIHLNLLLNCIIINNTFRSNNQNINIKNCLISVFLPSGSGGSIYISGSYYLNVSETTFYQCWASVDGGAIYTSGILNIFLNKICGIYCKSANHLYSYLGILNDQNIFLNLISISQCFNNTIGYVSLCLYQGNQNITNTNSSFNKNIYISGVYYVNPINMNSNFCTFFNNTVKDNRCIQLYGNKGYISKFNIINNNSPSLGVVYVGAGNYYLNESIFYNNQINLFYSNSGSSLTLYNCIINQIFNTYGIINLNFINNISTNSYKINFFTTQFIYSNILINYNNNLIINTYNNFILTCKFIIILFFFIII